MTVERYLSCVFALPQVKTFLEGFDPRRVPMARKRDLKIALYRIKKNTQLIAISTVTTERQLLERLRDPQQRQSAFSDLVEDYGPRLHAHILRMLHSRVDADDVLQNTLIKVHRGLDRFRGESQLYSWLYRIATNEALGWMRKRREHLSLDVEEEAGWVDRQLQAASFFDGDAALRKLHAGIATLPDKQRAVFNLRYFDEMPYQKMSDILGTSVGALKASYHHAAKKIESYLSHEG